MPNDFNGWDDPDYIDSGTPYTMERLPKLDGTMYDKLRRIRAVLPELLYMVNADLAPLPLMLLVQNYTYIVITVDEGTTDIGNYYVDTAKLLGAGTQEITYAVSENDKVHINTETGAISINVAVADNGKTFPVTITGIAEDGRSVSKVIRIAIKIKVIEAVNTPPVITLVPFPNGDLALHHQTAEPDGVFTDPGAEAVDLEDGNLTSEIVVSGDEVLANTAGTYSIVYTVTDSKGLSASISRTIIIDAPPQAEEITITYTPESVELNPTTELTKEYDDDDDYYGTWLTRPLDVNEHRVSSKILAYETTTDAKWAYNNRIVEKWAIETMFPLESNVQDIINIVESKMAMPIPTYTGDDFIVEEFVDPATKGLGAPHIQELADGRTEITWWISVNGGADYSSRLQGYLKIKTSDVKFTVMSSTRGDITDTATVNRVASMPDDMDMMIWEAQTSEFPTSKAFDLSQTVSAAKTDGTIVSKTIDFIYSYQSMGIN